MQRPTLVAIAILHGLCRLASGEEAASTAADSRRQPGVTAAEFLFQDPPFAQCHAATIVETPTGLLAAWFGGTREKHPDTGIWLSRQSGRVWTPPVEVANGVQYYRPDGAVERFACWNPVLFQPATGPLLLFYKCGPDPKSWWGMWTASSDNGQTWAKPRRLPVGILGPIKNKPVELADGTIICPSSTEEDGWKLHLELTRDLGETWTRSDALNDPEQAGAIQPTILFHRDGRWQMLARDRRRLGNIWTTWSADAGKTWSGLASTRLPNPSSGVDAVTLADDRQLLVYNHTQRSDEDASFGKSRGMLNVALSDDGVNWQAALLLENSAGEFSYPAVIQTRDGLVHIAYTWKRENIRHVVLDPTKLELRPIVDGRWPDSPAREQ